MITFKNIAVYFNKEKKHNKFVSKEIAAFISGLGFKTKIYDDFEEKRLAANTDLLVCVGGDGTALQAAREAAKRNIKIFAINAGHLGFLTGADLVNYKEILPQILAGKYIKQDLNMLSVNIFRDGKQPVIDQLAFNDCVLKTAGSRAFTLEMTMTGKSIQKYFGDGVIVATPTGSTAYSLAAGGPIVHPDIDIVLVTPICPHSLTQRPLVIPYKSHITFTPQFKRESDSAVVSLDGQASYKINSGDHVSISGGTHRVKLLQPEGYDFFQILNAKFKWGNK